MTNNYNIINVTALERGKSEAANCHMSSPLTVALYDFNQSINQSIIYFVLNSTRNKYNGQYTVEQDTKA